MDEHEGKLKRELGMKEVFAISAGAMISSGLFVLPAVVYLKTGPAILVAYLLSSIFILPALLSKAELSTAMPKSGGIYFFTVRSFGPLIGTYIGMASWFSLALKSSFALVGIGVFLQPLVPVYSPYVVKLIAVGFTVIFTVLNLFSVKESGRIQVILVGFLLAVLLIFVVMGAGKIELSRFEPFNPSGWRSIFLVTGMIFISFGGLTKVSSVAEEIKDPGKNIPIGMFLAYAVVSLFYLLVISVTVGLLKPESFRETLTPISSAAEVFAGRPGFIILAAAAMLAFITTANAGIMAASRSPMAMSRDKLLPALFSRVSQKRQTPSFSIILTSLFMIACILFLDMENLVKVASTMKLILFSVVNLSVIMMRESKIVSYQPKFRAPLYPYLQIAGIIIYLLLIIQMGILPLALTAAFFVLSLFWYLVFGRSRVDKQSAFIQMMGKVTNKELLENENQLEMELLSILRERDKIKEDRFDSIIRDAEVLDLDKKMTREEFFSEIADTIGKRWNMDPESIHKKLNEREEQASTLIYPGVAIPHALPHIIIEGKYAFDIIPVRNRKGIVWNESGDIVYTAFCLLGSKDERDFHLKALMAIAQILQDPDFHKNWTNAGNSRELKSVILLSKRRRHHKD